MTDAYDQVKAQGKAAALTLYYTAPNYTDAQHEMFPWASTNIPDAMKSGLDYVLVSYYEDDNGGYQPDWPTVFSQLAAMFPNAKLGIGECGTTNSASKSAYLTRYYSMSMPATPRFVGGYFWWHFSEDVVPFTDPLWQTLSNLIAAGG
jgi:hypothetical protein